MRSLLYCQHSLGLGHFMRTVQLANELAEAGSTAIIAGGVVPDGISIDERVILERLPAINMSTEGALSSADPAHAVDSVMRERHAGISAFVQAFEPDVLLIEMFPFGRKKFRAEILHLIALGSNRYRAAVYCSVRDILVTARKDQVTHDQRAAACLNENFDGVLVHSDSDLVRLDETFSEVDALKIPVFYTGFVSRRPVIASDRRKRIVVSAGGGRVGHALIDCALRANQISERCRSHEMLVIAGPLANETALSPDENRNVRVVAFEPELPRLIASSVLSISQCGYNTAAELLATQTPAIFVPFETESENEQLHRATLLERRKRAIVIRQKDLNSRVLADAIDRIETKPAPLDISLDGAVRTRELLLEQYRAR